MISSVSLEVLAFAELSLANELQKKQETTQVYVQKTAPIRNLHALHSVSEAANTFRCVLKI